ncbi:MAG: hypothetical protein H0T46_03270 [Deltaproteobacteria bacterium]|nr:hypothetical protein [Deltaproteobacteria bacterium]
MRLLAIGLFAELLVHTSVASARGPGKPPADLVPFGVDWSCFRPLDPKAATTDTPRCERTMAACKEVRATLSEPAKMTACAAQETATVITYYDPQRTLWRFTASPDDDGCLAVRKVLLATKAYAPVTQCEEIGKRFPRPSKLESSAITPGKTWWCLQLPSPAPKGARPACTRTVATCEEAIRRDSLGGTKCAERSTAYVLTFRDSSRWGYVASATSEACTAYRERVLPATSSVSACAATGAVARPKLDRKKLPKGRGWVCFAGADPAHNLGSCARTAKDCAAQYELDRYVLGASAGCRAQGTAQVRNVQEQIFAFPTAALCEAHVAQHPDGSRCEAIK